MFTIVNGVLLRPLPYRDPDRLVTLSEAREQNPIATFSYPNFQDLQQQNQSFESMAAWQALDQSASMSESAAIINPFFHRTVARDHQHGYTTGGRSEG
jgi:hypothetical protein